MGLSTFDNQPPPCDFCGGQSQFMGTRGDLDWWSCEDCGMQFSTPADDSSDPWDGSDEW